MRAGPGSHGFALAVAVFALALIAALLAGMFFAAHQELRLGRNALGMERAFAAAEGGVGATLATWSPAKLNALGEWRSSPFAGTLPAGTGEYAGVVTRLNQTLFLVRATGRDGGGTAQRTVAQLARLVPAALDVTAALTLTGRLEMAASSVISGEDHAPEGWACPPEVAGAGVRIRDPALIVSADCPPASCIGGSPAVRRDSALGDSAFGRAYEASWNELAALAARRYPDGSGPVTDVSPVGTATSCDSSASGNWGDPSAPPAVAGCTHYLPITRAEGSLRVSGGSGQGVLLVQGDLVVEGGFQFRGVLLVRGTLSILAGGGRLVGAVEAGNVVLRPGIPSGSAEIVYSSCAVRAALLQNAGAAPLAPRGWAELY